MLYIGFKDSSALDCICGAFEAHVRVFPASVSTANGIVFNGNW